MYTNTQIRSVAADNLFYNFISIGTHVLLYIYEHLHTNTGFSEIPNKSHVGKTP